MSVGRRWSDTPMGLTVLAIKAAKGREKPYKLADSGGLHLLVFPSGRRYWRMNYRYLGRHKTLAFGVWPDVDLAGCPSQARRRAQAARQRSRSFGSKPSWTRSQRASLLPTLSRRSPKNGMPKPRRKGWHPPRSTKSAGCSISPTRHSAIVRLRKILPHELLLVPSQVRGQGSA